MSLSHEDGFVLVRERAPGASAPSLVAPNKSPWGVIGTCSGGAIDQSIGRSK
jgi:hypothetical protein